LFGWVVREGLTNVVRHSKARTCHVHITPGAIEVVDDGSGGSPQSGNGLSGLTERVAAMGGSLEVGPVQPRGWRLAVSLAGAPA
jgi:two-component system sensor histidine kinase DesK